MNTPFKERNRFFLKSVKFWQSHSMLENPHLKIYNLHLEQLIDVFEIRQCFESGMPLVNGKSQLNISIPLEKLLFPLHFILENWWELSMVNIHFIIIIYIIIIYIYWNIQRLKTGFVINNTILHSIGKRGLGQTNSTISIDWFSLKILWFLT